jgi:hypothetical protein
MQTTSLQLNNDTEQTNCGADWCDGPDSDTLPCFACFDPTREYNEEAAE